MPYQRIVVDTNVLISRLLSAESVPGRAVRRAVEEAQLLLSEPTFDEIAEVLSRPKFEPYLSAVERQTFLAFLDRVAEKVPLTHVIRACRDPNDDKFLEAAVSGQADVLITGDRDLLALDPFQGIPIITPASYLASG